jgi:FkbM family methyltransferase
MILADHLLRKGIAQLGKKRWETFIVWLSRLGEIDLWSLAQHEAGILNYQDFDQSGEAPFVKYLLREWLTEPELTFLDVGANTGDFSSLLRKEFPHAEIHAFEPASATFSKLSQTPEAETLHLHAMGLSHTPGTAEIYIPEKECMHEHSSMYADVHRHLHERVQHQTETVKLDTLDAFCDHQRIEKVDFLKIDTEGHELCVLQGAEKLLQEDRIRVILFEFNEMNIISKVFLKDFYDLLKDFSFYRLGPKGLIPLWTYQSKNEIFQFQNILAVSKEGTPSPQRIHRYQKEG